jgi:hypothetical protein
LQIEDHRDVSFLELELLVIAENFPFTPSHPLVSRGLR